MMDKPLTKEQEKCLETIQELSQENGRVRITHLAAVLKVSKPSINYAIGILSEMGLVHCARYGWITLTQEGEKRVSAPWDLHILLCQFLTDIVGVSKKVAEIDAYKIEHVISQETISQIQKLVEQRELEVANRQADSEEGWPTT